MDRWSELARGSMAEADCPMDPIDFSTPGDADKVLAIESWTEGDIEVVTVEFSDGEIESMPMSRAEARASCSMLRNRRRRREIGEGTLLPMDPHAVGLVTFLSV